jgi:hypothetical protein
MRRGSFRALPTLGIVAAALAGFIGLEMREGTLDQASPSAAPTNQQAKRLPVSSEVPGNQAAQHMAIILTRPLFGPSRRPDAVAANDAAAGLGRLTGVMVSPTGKSAIFAGPVGGKSVVVVEGARIGEYVVGSIDVGAVTIMGPEGQRVLHPVFDPSPPPPKPTIPGPIVAPTIVGPAPAAPVVRTPRAK